MRKLTYTNTNSVSIVISDILYGTTSITGLGVPGVEIQDKKAPFQDGSTHIDQLFEPREIVVEGTINKDSLIDIYQYRRVMAKAFNPKLGPGTLLYENDNGSWLLQIVTPIGPEFSNRNANDGAQKWMTTFYCYDPYFKNPVETELNLAGEGTVLATNNGDVDCPVEILIVGPITNPKVINNTTGEYLQIIKTLAAGEYVLFYTGFGNKVVYVNSGEVPAIEFPVMGGGLNEGGEIFSEILQYNGMQYLVLTSTFFSLETGVNELELIDAGSNTGMTMNVKYRERFVGV